MVRRKGIRGIITGVIIVVLLTGIIGAVIFLTNGDAKAGHFSVEIGGTEYFANAEGLVLANDAEIIVGVTLDDDYNVKVCPKSAREDFAFLIGDEEYHWSDVRTTEFTAGFGITRTENGFVISYINLATVISAVLPGDYGAIRVPSGIVGDLFELCITSGDSAIVICFTLAELGGKMSVTHIELNIDNIIF